MFSILSFDIISVLLTDSKILLCIPASAAHAAAVNPNSIKTLLANVLITCFIESNPGFSNGLRNPLDCITLDN